jgi:hypothetical protein
MLTRAEIITGPRFTGTLQAADIIGVCAGCGHDMTHPAGILPLGVQIRLVCSACLTRPLVAILDPRRPGVCQCARPVPCPCGRSCFMCTGDLESWPALTA